MTVKHTILFAALLALPALAHHSIPAEYDDKKSVTLRGVVTGYEWTNPHVYVTVDVPNSGGTKWEAEFGTTLDLRKAGWTRESLNVGDSVTVEGIAARDGSKKISGKSVTPANGKKLNAATPYIKTAVARATKSGPAPRWPDGTVRLGAAPGVTGYWANPSNGIYDSTAGNIRMNVEGQLANIADAPKVAPFQSWSRELYRYRQQSMLKDDPMAACLPAGGPRQFQAPYGFTILEEPARKRLFIMSGGSNRNWRLIYTDGRALPESEDTTPTFFGFSTAKWEGDTLVVNSNSYIERFWFANGGLPHTEALRLTERISRPDANTLRYEIDVNDPGTYTRPWKSGFSLQWIPEEFEEYFCDDHNRETDHLSGK